MKHPSFFSRLYETADALRSVTDDLRNGYRSAKDQEYLIVQECLDVMEMLYVQDERIEVVTVSWNELERPQQTDPLYIRMSKLIQDDAESLFSIDSERGIGIILREGKVIGGLSPLTLVYTKPGILGGLREDAWNLSSRRYSFIRYLYSLASDRMLPEILRDYVFAGLHGHMDLIQRLESDHQLPESLERMRDRDGAEVLVNGNYIYQNTADNMVAGSGYLIRNSKAMTSGSERLPLVLSPYGIPGTSYVRDLIWHPDFMQSRDLRDIQDRVLLGTGLRYPYMTEEDFLADRIIECDSCQRSISQLYLYRVAEDHYVMLPLRQTFFDYFTIEDVDNLLSIDYVGGCYHVYLDVPVQAGAVRFHKIYRQDDIVELNLDREFNMAISPFLVTEDLPHHVIAFKNRRECVMRFFNSETNAEISSETVRSELNIGDGAGSLVFAKTEKPWDYMTLTVSGQGDEEAEGIIIPKFGRPMAHLPEEYQCSIIVNDRNIRVLLSNPRTGRMEPLEFGNDSRLVCAMADTSRFDAILRQCFISVDHDADSHKSMARIPLSVNIIVPSENVEMLEGGNIAFNPCDWVPPHVHQVRNLFSANRMTDNRQAEKVFCQEIAYLIRLFSIEKELAHLPMIRVEVPLWLSRREANHYRDAWFSAFDAVGIHEENIEFVDCHAQQFERDEAVCLTCGEAIHVDVDAYHTVLFRAGAESDSIHYRIHDFGVNNLYGVVEPFHSHHENAYIRQIAGSGQHDPELMNMLDEHKDCLDILERSLEINDYSCREVREFMLPYAFFIGALADAIVDFVKESGLGNSIDIILSGDGLRLLRGISVQTDLNRTLQGMIINKGKFDSISVDIHIMENREGCTIMQFYPRHVPRMVRYLPTGVQDVDVTQDKVNDIIEKSGLKMLSDLSLMVDREWMDGALQKLGIRSKKWLLGLFESSYMHCAHDYIHSNSMHDKLQVPDMRFWPYSIPCHDLRLMSISSACPE